MKKSSGKRLTLEERKKMEELLHQNMKHRDIAKACGFNFTTLYRELKKCQGAYNAEEAHNNTGRGFHPIDWTIIGKRFGLLTVEGYANKYKGRTWWNCKCDCGRYITISRKMLSDYCSPDRALSCGCVPKESRGAAGKVPFEEAALRKFEDLLTFREINNKTRCWNWTGYMQNGKVPRCSWKNKSMSVRKCMYLLMNGTTHEPNHIYAACGNRSCFNPDHLTMEKPVYHD